MFKVNNEDTRTIGVFIANFEHILHFIVNFKYLIAGWVIKHL